MNLQFRPLNEPDKNTIGLEPYFDEDEQKWKYRHVARHCDVCKEPRSVTYGLLNKWFCTDCWLIMLEKLPIVDTC